MPTACRNRVTERALSVCRTSCGYSNGSLILLALLGCHCGSSTTWTSCGGRMLRPWFMTVFWNLWANGDKVNSRLNGQFYRTHMVNGDSSKLAGVIEPHCGCHSQSCNKALLYSSTGSRIWKTHQLVT
jgi:hypothetical protein